MFRNDEESEAGTLSDEAVVWMGAPYGDDGTDPTAVELFAAEDRAIRYVESLAEEGVDQEWASWNEYEGRRLTTSTGETVGVVSPLRTTASGEQPPFRGGTLDRLLSSDSTLRSTLPVVTDRPSVARDLLPFALFDLALLSERGHLRLQVGRATGSDPGRYLEELARYAEGTVSAATSASDDRVARNRIRDLDDYFRVEDDTAYYGKPRYRLAKRLSDWGGETSRYACLELWLLFQLVLRLYPDHVSWESGYEYHDDH